MSSINEPLKLLHTATTNLTASRHRIILDVKQPMHLPEYKGFALRGAFGPAFQRAVCAANGACFNCLQRDACPYPKLFEPLEQQRTGQQLARPFLFEPPLEAKRDYAPGECLQFAIVLFGEGQAYLPHFLLAFQILGEVGIGVNRSKFELRQVDSEFPAGCRSPHQSSQDRVEQHQQPIGWEQVRARSRGLAASGRVRLTFSTPTRLRSDARLQKEISVDLLIRAALRRFMQVAIDCGKADLSLVDTADVLHLGDQCDLSEAQLRWHDVERYSSRQRQRMSMSGLIGSALLQGESLPSLLPLLVWMETMHIGKNTVFGLGQASLSPA